MKFCRWMLLVAMWALLVAPARAEQVRGEFRYDDARGNSTPIRFATVEIYRHRPGQIGWSMDLQTTTDNFGWIDVTLPFAGSNVLTSLRVYADNPAVKVLKQDDPFQTFYQKPGWPSTEIQRVTWGPDDVLEFDYTFPDEWSAAHYNAAHAVRLARAYADARRDPRETDPLNWLHVQIQNNSANTYYDPVSSRIRISVANALSDLTVVHEYAHFLEHKISGFQAQATWHDGCRMLNVEPPGGVDVASPGLAWMEGFADYFAQAVARAFPGEITEAPDGTFATTSIGELETPSMGCGNSPTPEKVEDFVAGALWDLIDTGFELGDRMCSFGFATETLVFQIFDHELDIGTNPTLQHFVDAWINRGLDLPPLLSAFGSAAVNLVVPATLHRYEPDAGADWAVWRPSDGTFYVLWGDGTWNRSPWGQSGDVPVPADYDGDGFTDVAIWRPADGNWWVILSRTNRIQVTQWGTAGDVPLPADYDVDGEIDFAVYRPSSQQVFIKSDTCGFDQVRWVGPGTPVVGQFDTDGRPDTGVFDGWTSTFTIQLTDQKPPKPPKIMPMGGSGLQTPVVGDYDGDGLSDFAIFTPGQWTVLKSSTGKTETTWFGSIWIDWRSGTFWSFPTPVPADFDGDGRTDLAVWYASDGMWNVLASTAGWLSQQWGTAGDQLVPRR